MVFTPAQLNRRAELYHQLGAMITAGIPLIRALEMAGSNAALRSSGKTISALLEHLKNGLSFSDSMKRAQGWLPEFDIALLSAGEHSGRLDSSFKFLGEYYAARALIIRDTLSRLILPVANLHVFLLIFPLGFLILFAMGIFNNNYTQCLPFILEKIAVFGSFYAIILFFIFACQGKRGEPWRAGVERLAQSVPLLRTAQKYLVLARLSASLEALVNSGASIVKSWPLAATASGSPHLKRQVATWEAELAAGVTPAELVSRTRYFPEMFANLYHTGEISGKLDESLKRLQVYYQEEGLRMLGLSTKIFSGTVYGVIAALIAYNVIKFWMHYYGGLVNGIQ